MKPIFVGIALIFTSPAIAADSGEYLARAADCVACHTNPGGTPYAGGRAVKLPFGTIYSPNITPDPETGIGGYTDAEWLKALQDGIGRGGRHLYPAMPYNSYTLMSSADALAIKAYLFGLKPVHAPNKPAELRFPFNQRWGMTFWNIANNPGHRFEPDANKSADWNRGAYLVQALGHCDQCHTPRNWMQGLKKGAAFSGARQVGWQAYNITSDPVHGIGGWKDADLEQYLATGTAPGHGPASGPMAEVITNSTRFLTKEDIHAMLVYLRSIPPVAAGPEAVAVNVAPAQGDPLGARVFATACQGCHLPTGTGRQSAWAALGGDRGVGDPHGTNMVQILAHGSDMQTPSGYVFMHAFTGAYTDTELAAVANYVTAQLAGRQSQVTPAEIAAARAE
jgi:mono/diheme cytochrome c family protein